MLILLAFANTELALRLHSWAFPADRGAESRLPPQAPRRAPAPDAGLAQQAELGSNSGAPPRPRGAPIRPSEASRR